jgi:hypothetical protein
LFQKSKERAKVSNSRDIEGAVDKKYSLGQCSTTVDFLATIKAGHPL